MPGGFAPFTEGYGHDNRKPVLGGGWHGVTGLLDVTHRGVQVLQVSCQCPLVHCRRRVGSAGLGDGGLGLFPWHSESQERGHGSGGQSVCLSAQLCTSVLLSRQGGQLDCPAGTSRLPGALGAHT